MYTKKVFKAADMARRTRYETLLFLTIGIITVALYQILELHWLSIPWTPLALIGTAVAFVIGFQNNSAYGRIWEARKIWGGIVNTSRTLDMFLQDMLSNEHATVKCRLRLPQFRYHSLQIMLSFNAHKISLRFAVGIKWPKYHPVE